MFYIHEKYNKETLDRILKHKMMVMFETLRIK
jgi:hypothetical protein